MEWSAEIAMNTKVGELFFLFKPFGVAAESGELHSVAFVFRDDSGFAMCCTLTDEEYEFGFLDGAIAAIAQAALDEGKSFALCKASPSSDLTVASLKRLEGMHKWSASGSRSASANGDPLYFYLSAITVELDPSLSRTPLNLNQVLQSIVGPETQEQESQLAKINEHLSLCVPLQIEESPVDTLELNSAVLQPTEEPEAHQSPPLRSPNLPVVEQSPELEQSKQAKPRQEKKESITLYSDSHIDELDDLIPPTTGKPSSTLFRNVPPLQQTASRTNTKDSDEAVAAALQTDQKSSRTAHLDASTIDDFLTDMQQETLPGITGEVAIVPPTVARLDSSSIEDFLSDIQKEVTLTGITGITAPEGPSKPDVSHLDSSTLGDFVSDLKDEMSQTGDPQVSAEGTNQEHNDLDFMSMISAAQKPVAIRAATRASTAVPTPAEPEPEPKPAAATSAQAEETAQSPTLAPPPSHTSTPKRIKPVPFSELMSKLAEQSQSSKQKLNEVLSAHRAAVEEMVNNQAASVIDQSGIFATLRNRRDEILERLRESGETSALSLEQSIGAAKESVTNQIQQAREDIDLINPLEQHAAVFNDLQDALVSIEAVLRERLNSLVSEHEDRLQSALTQQLARFEQWDETNQKSSISSMKYESFSDQWLTQCLQNQFEDEVSKLRQVCELEVSKLTLAQTRRDEVHNNLTEVQARITKNSQEVIAQVVQPAMAEIRSGTSQTARELRLEAINSLHSHVEETIAQLDPVLSLGREAVKLIEANGEEVQELVSLFRESAEEQTNRVATHYADELNKLKSSRALTSDSKVKPDSSQSVLKTLDLQTRESSARECIELEATFKDQVEKTLTTKGEQAEKQMAQLRSEITSITEEWKLTLERATLKNERRIDLVRKNIQTLQRQMLK